MNKTQDVRGAINSVKASLQNETKIQPEGAEANVGESFHNKERKRKNADPDNDALKRAVITGKAKAEVFLAVVRNQDHADHFDFLQRYRDEFGNDNNKVEAAFIKQSCESSKASAFEYQDHGYEQAIIKKYKPAQFTSLEQQAAFNNFEKTMKSKWHQSGYARDKHFIAGAASLYSLTPNDRDYAMQQIQPKE